MKKKHQIADWQQHKPSCVVPTKTKVAFESKSSSEIADYFISLRPQATPMTDKQASNLVASVHKYIENRGDKPKILIVGCGENPYGWQEGLSNINNWRQMQTEDTGDHSHSGAFTVAEDLRVMPKAQWDWLNPIPKAIYAQFDIVYLEKQPPRVLAQRIVFQNAFHALKSGGVLEFDIQTCQASRDDVDEILFLDNAPFEMVLTTEIAEFLKKPSDEEAAKLNETHRMSYYLLSNNPPMGFLKSHGFKNIKAIQRTPNPYNGRTRPQSTGVAQKP